MTSILGAGPLQVPKNKQLLNKTQPSRHSSQISSEFLICTRIAVP